MSLSEEEEVPKENFIYFHTLSLVQSFLEIFLSSVVFFFSLVWRNEAGEGQL